MIRYLKSIMAFLLLSGCAVSTSTGPTSAISLYVTEGSFFSVNMDGSIGSPSSTIAGPIKATPDVVVISGAKPDMCNETSVPDNTLINIIFEQTRIQVGTVDGGDSGSPCYGTEVITARNAPSDTPANQHPWFTVSPDEINDEISNENNAANVVQDYISGVKSGTGTAYGFISASPQNENTFSPGVGVCFLNRADYSIPQLRKFTPYNVTLPTAFMYLQNGDCSIFFGSTASLHTLYTAFVTQGVSASFSTDPGEWLSLPEYQAEIASAANPRS